MTNVLRVCRSKPIKSTISIAATDVPVELQLRNFIAKISFRDFTAATNEKWLTDVTEFNMK